jgi:hypothetical protein
LPRDLTGRHDSAPPIESNAKLPQKGVLYIETRRRIAIPAPTLIYSAAGTSLADIDRCCIGKPDHVGLLPVFWFPTLGNLLLEESAPAEAEGLYITEAEMASRRTEVTLG